MFVILRLSLQVLDQILTRLNLKKQNKKRITANVQKLNDKCPFINGFLKQPTNYLLYLAWLLHGMTSDTILELKVMYRYDIQ